MVELAFDHSRHLVFVDGEDELLIFLKSVGHLGCQCAMYDGRQNSTDPSSSSACGVTYAETAKLQWR
eukprot:4450264-Prorocentrum_lima.AAC.1